MGQKLKFAVRLLVSVLLLAVLIYIAGPAQIYNELINSRIDYNFAGFLLILLGTFIAVYRWYIIMNELDFPKTPFSFYFWGKQSWNSFASMSERKACSSMIWMALPLCRRARALLFWLLCLTGAPSTR